MIRFDINLAAPEIAQKRIERRSAWAASALLIALLGFDLVRWNDTRSTQAEFGGRLARVSGEVGKIEADLQRLGRATGPTLQEAMQTEVDAVNHLIRRRHFSWVGFLHDIGDHVSSDISIRQIAPAEKNDTVSLSGIARSVPDLAAFVDRLQKDGAFQEVFLLDQKQVNKEVDGSEEEAGEGEGGLSFSIRFRYAALGGEG